MKKHRQSIAMFFWLCLLLANTASAQFEWDFASHSSSASNNTMNTTPLHQINGTTYQYQSGQTPFLTENGWNTGTGEEWQAAELITLDIDGEARKFYHLVLGDMTTGFIQETYIEMGYAMVNSGGTFLNGVQPAQDGVHSNYASASAGNYTVTRSGGLVVDAANGMDPLGASANSGSGTANPKRVVVLQLNNDGEMFSEFRKDTLLNKPVINQRLTRFGEIEVNFSMDMSNSTYDDMDTAGVMVNTVRLYGEGLPQAQIGMPDSTNFDAVAQQHSLNVTGGRYIYTPGSGGASTDHPGGSDGTYTYAQGTFDQKAITWDQYYDPNDPTGNPWSYPAGKP